MNFHTTSIYQDFPLAVVKAEPCFWTKNQFHFAFFVCEGWGGWEGEGRKRKKHKNHYENKRHFSSEGMACSPSHFSALLNVFY